jgi:hypothetical protein
MAHATKLGSYGGNVMHLAHMDIENQASRACVWIGAALGVHERDTLQVLASGWMVMQDDARFE